MKVRRDEILDYVTYEERRAEMLESAIEAKEARRVVVADVLTFLFENRETVRHQIQEMVRIEKMVKESDILHELETYNEILPEPGGLAATLLIGIDDPRERDRLLRAWVDLPRHVYLRNEQGGLIRPRYDARQVGEDRLSAVQFLQFPAVGGVPVAVGVDHPGLTGESLLNPAQRQALRADLEA